jgi:hypothetical protein
MQPQRQLLEQQWKGLALRLTQRQFVPHFFNDPSELYAFIDTMITKDTTVGVGGSMTLNQLGMVDYLREHSQLFDRYAKDLTPQQVVGTLTDALSADLFVTSTNALTLAGELVNVDGTGNRVAAMIYGPKTVIVILGRNKLVKDVEEARLRIRRWAAPINNTRLGRNNPCQQTGYCVDCLSEGCICSSEVVIRRSHQPQRIHICLLDMELGY